MAKLKQIDKHHGHSMLLIQKLHAKIPCYHLENHTVYASLHAAEALQLQRMGSLLWKIEYQQLNSGLVPCQKNEKRKVCYSVNV
jgi:hypothetical protein